MDARAARLLLADDPEAAMRADMAAAIAARRAQGPPPRPPGDALRLLLVGYAGAGNIGADIRVHETVRQLRAIFGRVTIGLVTRGASTAAPDAVAHEDFGGYFPAGMDAVVARYDAVLVCEGSLFTSTFSNTLTTMLAGALGIAAAQGKPAIAYGVDAGSMDAGMAAFVQAHCRGSVVFCRSAASLARVRALGLDARPGADTAWTFAPAPPAAADAILRAGGWNGADPVLALCPVNPFWWPVRPDVARALSGEAGGPDHHDSILFHHRDGGTDARFAAYIAALADAAARHLARTGAFAVVIGMERLDRPACVALAAALPGPAPIVTGDDTDARTAVALLRRVDLVVTSRFHAVLMAMGGGVPVIGVGMDERLADLLADTGRPSAALSVGDPALAERLAAAMRAPAAVAGASIGRQLLAQGAMGRELARLLGHRARPDAAGADPSAWLPPLPEALRRHVVAARAVPQAA